MEKTITLDFDEALLLLFPLVREIESARDDVFSDSHVDIEVQYTGYSAEEVEKGIFEPHRIKLHNLKLLFAKMFGCSVDEFLKQRDISLRGANDE